MKCDPSILRGAEVLPPLEPDDAKPPRKPGQAKKQKGKTGSDRFGVLNTFVDVTLRQLDNTASVVWLILYRDTKPDGLVSTSQTDLARRAGVSVSTVYRALQRLRGLGLLTVVRTGTLGSGATVHRISANMTVI